MDFEAIIEKNWKSPELEPYLSHNSSRLQSHG